MKKIVSILLLFSCLLSSCGTGTTDGEIAANLENYESLYGETSPGDTETQYFSTVDTGVEGIISNDWIIHDNKYYFVTKKMSGLRRTGVEMISYIDLETGDSHIICPDPLCEHELDGNCKYVGFGNIFIPEPGVIYSVKIIDQIPPVHQFYKLDLNKGTVEALHKTNVFVVALIGMDDKKIYFYEMVEETEGKTTRFKKYYYCLDTETDQVESIDVIPEPFASEFASPLFIHDGELYHTTVANQLVKTDLTFQNSTVIYQLYGNDVGSCFYDTNTDEFYFSVINQDAGIGSVYVYSDGETKKVQLPDENIYSFTLTNSKIYYSTYNPIYYGISSSPNHGRTYDYSGGKLYVTDRETRSEAELIYDCSGKYLLCNPFVSNYCVLGDYLYFDEVELLHEKEKQMDGTIVEYHTFSYAFNMSKIRVNLTTGEMKQIVFE